ncbi:MAG: pilus assembly PilX N-terminal domain-containing protein [candidate division NC10 bacterium]|nr:pilus assembly PilX N-terminal domain-containing protein [candidate division NC10 bacterium]
MSNRPLPAKGKGQSPSRDEQGAVLGIVIMLMALLFIVGWVLISLSVMQGQIASNEVEMIQALYVAEGGIHVALNQLNQGITPSTSGSIGTGQYVVSVTDVSPPSGTRRIDAYGYIPSQASARAMKRVSVLVMRPSPFNWGAFGDTKVTLGGGALTDSFDSGVGAYGPSNVYSNGDVGSNGNIDFSGKTTQVRGDATAGGTVQDPNKVTGVSTNGAPPVPLSLVDCPAGGYTPAASVPTGTGITYNATTGDLNISVGANLTLAPGTYYFHNVSMTGGSTLTVAGGGSVVIYCSGQFDLTGGTVVNPSGFAANMVVYGCGTNTTDWIVTGGATAYYAVYAPTHKLTFPGGSAFYGSVVGKEVVNTVGAFIHYDEALTRIPGLDPYEIVPRSWTELNP